jgi:putative phosphoesterase
MSMLIGIISDTHDRLGPIDAALALFQKKHVQLVIHCGDWAKPETVKYFAERARERGLPVKGVLGNNDKQADKLLAFSHEQSDSFELIDDILELAIEGTKITAYHGHHQPTVQRLLNSDNDVLLLGHSHKPRHERLGDLQVINPGSTAFAIPRRKDWQASVALYNTKTSHCNILYFSAK